jgi:hypothetical protein
VKCNTCRKKELYRFTSNKLTYLLTCMSEIYIYRLLHTDFYNIFTPIKKLTLSSEKYKDVVRHNIGLLLFAIAVVNSFHHPHFNSSACLQEQCTFYNPSERRIVVFRWHILRRFWHFWGERQDREGHVLHWCRPRDPVTAGKDATQNLRAIDQPNPHLSWNSYNCKHESK